jgi:hypothetical protein
MSLEVTTKNDLLMVLIGLEAVSELLDSDERMTDYRRDSYAMLFNRVAEAYAELATTEEEHLVLRLAEGYEEL